MTSPFAPPGFRRFWAGEAVSGLGTYVTLLALQVLVVVDLGGGPVQTGWLSSARWLPYLVLGLLVGALVDRVRRRPVMIVSDLLRMVLLGGDPDRVGARRALAARAAADRARVRRGLVGQRRRLDVVPAAAGVEGAPAACPRVYRRR